MNDLKNYLPPFMRDIQEFNHIMAVEQEEFKNLWDYGNNFANEAFVESSGVYGVERMEKILGIKPDPAQSLDERKTNILIKFYESRIITEKTLLQALNNVCGTENYILETDIKNYRINIYIKLNAKLSLNAVLQMTKRLAPMNMEINVELKYNRWNDLKSYRWEKFKDRSWKYLREEVI